MFNVRSSIINHNRIVKIMAKSCAVHGCKSYKLHQQGKVKGISFHKFPRDEILKSKWCLVVRRKDFRPTESSCICSAHFKSTDFEIPDKGSRGLKKRLKKAAVPSIFTNGSTIYHLQAPEKNPHLQAREEQPFSNVTVSLPRTYENNVTKLPSPQLTKISKDVEVTGAENDPLEIATADETTEQQQLEQKHDITNVNAKRTNVVQKTIPTCGVCKYQAKSEDDLKHHLFEEIRQLQVNKVSRKQDLQAVKPMQPSNKDQKQSSSDVRDKAVSSVSEDIACCSECKYEAKNEEDLKNHLFQKHPVQGDEEPINQSDSEEEQHGSNINEKEAHSMKKDVPDVPCCGVCNYRAKNEADLRQHLFEEIRQMRANKSHVQKNQTDESHANCSNLFIDMASIQEGTIVSHCGCAI